MDGEAGVVEGAELGGGDDEDGELERGGEVGDGEIVFI